MTGRADTNQFRWGFSTLGCPELSLPEVCELAAQYQFPQLEVRALQGRVDLPDYADDHGWKPPRAGELFEHHQVNMVVASSDFKLIGDSARRAEFLRFCGWADSWHAEYVRVFGGGIWGRPLTEAEFKAALESVAWWRSEKKARGWSIEILLETHDAFSASAPCCRLNKRLAKPLGLIWDTHHTWRLGGETPRQTWRRLSPWIRHVHIKDSVDTPSQRHPFTYVLPGEGQVPLAEIVELLREKKFAGTVSFEWERLWHPYLPPLPVALARLREQDWFKVHAFPSQVSAR
jgi:sugar phosphate isomerase/epimerase